MSDALARARAAMGAVPFHQWLKPELVELDPDRGTARTRLVFRSELARGGGTDFHGGVIASLIDLTAYAALTWHVKGPVPTMHLAVDYLRPALAPEIFAAARVVRAGKTVGLVDVEVTDEQARLISVGRGSFANLKSRDAKDRK